MPHEKNLYGVLGFFCKLRLQQMKLFVEVMNFHISNTGLISDSFGDKKYSSFSNSFLTNAGINLNLKSASYLNSPAIFPFSKISKKL
jgi:hypothetical protein